MRHDSRTENRGCAHVRTFDCHGGVRCSDCLVDALELADGSLRWPSSEPPEAWDAASIAAWFAQLRTAGLARGWCDGVEFCRDNRAGTYGYVWVEVVVDRDYEAAYLLDVRTHDGDVESRRYLFCYLSVDPPPPVWHDHRGGARLVSGVRFLADCLAQLPTTLQRTTDRV